MNDFIPIMEERGFIKDRNFTNAPEMMSAYIGFDLTAPSLHVGSLIQLMVLRWLKATGNKAFALLGDATTRIGDPSGKDTSRQMLPAQEIQTNRTGIMKAIKQVVPDIDFISNGDWFEGATPSLMDFLVEYGPHFTVNRMLTHDSIKRRLDRQQSLTVLEFSYMLLQAVDFREAFRTMDINTQIGGSDQWGNILNGIEIIRRMDSSEAFAFTTPLLLDRQGNKMGKSQGKPIWLDPEMTPVSEFFQYWRNCPDEDVGRFLLFFTEMPLCVLDHGLSVNGPGINAMKKILAFEVTQIVHGEEAAKKARDEADAVFERNDHSAVSQTIMVKKSIALIDVMVHAGLVESKSAAKRLIQQNAVTINQHKISDQNATVEVESIVRVGKKLPVKIEVR